jgi:hypothetical protein
MNLAQLKAACAAYHQKTTDELTINSIDLFLLAANNARRKAEQLHSFEYMRCTAKLNIDGVTGGSFASATIDQTNFVKLKEVVAVSVLRNGVFTPVDFTRADIEIERERSALELSNSYWMDARYPSDSQFAVQQGCKTIVQRAQALYLFPRVSSIAQGATNPLPVYIEGFGFLKDYVSSDLQTSTPTDFFIENGFEFMQWATIKELNYLFQTFVPRQEGNVIPDPKAERDEAWRDLLLWDAYIVDSHITRPK